MLALDPDAVVIATGGLPQNPDLEQGDDLVTSSWDIISGSVKPAENVLVYDDSGAHQGMTAAEMVARAGSTLELVSPERFFAPDMGGLNHVPYMKLFHEKGVRITINTRLHSVRRDGNQLVAVLCSDYADDWRDKRLVDQIVVEHATAPLDELYFELKPLSTNQGAVDYDGLVAGEKAFGNINADGKFTLFASAMRLPRAISTQRSMTG